MSRIHPVDEGDRVAFGGTLSAEDNLMAFSEVKGWFRWVDGGTALARIAGEIIVDRGGPFDLFRDLGVGSLRGRLSRLEIPGVGLSPVRVYSDGKILADGTTPVRFEAWSGPVPIATRVELAEALRTPMADALEEAGLAGLAGLARSAAVALDGFLPPPPRGAGPSPKPGRGGTDRSRGSSTVPS